MTAFDLDPNLRWLFCMTHPDDEISICAFIHRLVRNGNPVYISWTHSIPIRVAEAKAAASLIGVPQNHLYFFGATDGSVCNEMSELLPKFQEMMRQIQPDRVCCGAFEQGHIDHDSTNFLVTHTFKGPIYEIPFYHTYLTRLQKLNRFSDPRDEEVWDLDLEDQRFKTLIAKQYPSQNIWPILVWQNRARRLKVTKDHLVRSERMRRKTNFDFLRPNHPPRLARRVSESELWQRWVSAVNAVGDAEK
jgi:LmbE family N-acetylglucosaminyl deacetylase